MTSYARDEMVSVTDIVKGFKANLEKVTGHAVEKLAIMRNNKPEAVIVPVDDYENMKELYEYAERLSILEAVQKRKSTPKSEYISFDDVLKKPAYLVTNYEIRFHPDAKAEFFALDKGIRVLVSKQLAKLESSPELGELLGNKNGIDLSGLRKLYAAKKQIRIVYEIENSEIVVYIVAIGKREDMQAYKDALTRLGK